MTGDRLIENDSLVSVLSKALHWGGANLRDVPPLIKRILAEECWQDVATSIDEDLAAEYLDRAAADLAAVAGEAGD